MNINKRAAALEEKMTALRRDLHRHPELGFDVPRTAGIVAEIMKNLGLEVKTGVGKTGVVGDLKCGDGPTIALRADMDALPIQETGNLPFKSIYPGLMHACGHDGHTAILAITAEIIADMQNSLKGTVRFIFQPAEEGEGGARYMIKDGCLDGVKEIYGLHLWNYQKYGEVGTKAGPILAAADEFKIVVKGVGGHGAVPQGTVDAVVVSAHLITALQNIVSRNTDPLENTVVTVGMIKGGHNFNIIADEIVMRGTARAFSEENRQMIKTRMKTIIKGVGQTFGAEIKLDYKDRYPPTVNAEEQNEICLAAAKKIVGTGASFPALSMGGEDFAYYAQKIPAAFFFVGSSPPDQELKSVPHHCSHFNIDERSLLVGASVFVEIIQSRLGI
ncbi:MAG: amidohydrolase [Candidatus Neomarinimicrobiota bacterium]